MTYYFDLIVKKIYWFRPFFSQKEFNRVIEKLLIINFRDSIIQIFKKSHVTLYFDKFPLSNRDKNKMSAKGFKADADWLFQSCEGFDGSLSGTSLRAKFSVENWKIKHKRLWLANFTEKTCRVLISWKINLINSEIIIELKISSQACKLSRHTMILLHFSWRIVFVYMTARTRNENEAPPRRPATRQVPIVLPTESSRCLGATIPA